jgi:membrane protease YdiL (CAAX protease family)
MPEQGRKSDRRRAMHTMLQGNPEPPMVATLATALLIAAIPALWLRRRVIAYALVAMAIALALPAGLLAWPALLPVVLLAGAGVMACHRRPVTGGRAVRVLATMAVVVLALGMGLGVFPGFARFPVLPDVTFSDGAAVYHGNVNYAKVLAGLLVLGICVPRLGTWAGVASALGRAAPVAAVTTLVVIGSGWFVGYARPDPKWTALFFPWLLLNSLACVTEEAFFRGFIQARLAAALAPRPYGDIAAVLVTAALFGIAHIAGGYTYVALAALAGVGYGWVYRSTGSIEAAIATHLLLNTVHFLFFTYPRLA